jgi:enolase
MLLPPAVLDAQVPQQAKAAAKLKWFTIHREALRAAIKKVDDLIAPELAGLNADFQEEIDNTLHEIDGTTDFKNIGGNTAFAISLANAEAAANSMGLLLFQFLGGNAANTLPFPLGNCISGGAHARGGKHPSIQEYLALPHGAESFLEAQTANTKFTRKSASCLKRKAALYRRQKRRRRMDS